MLPNLMTHDATTTHAQRRDHVLTLLISAPDRPGLVAGVAGTLFEHDANILEADQHDDQGTGMFFQRIQFEIERGQRASSARRRWRPWEAPGLGLVDA